MHLLPTSLKQKLSHQNGGVKKSRSSANPEWHRPVAQAPKSAPIQRKQYNQPPQQQTYQQWPMPEKSRNYYSVSGSNWHHSLPRQLHQAPSTEQFVIEPRMVGSGDVKVANSVTTKSIVSSHSFRGVTNGMYRSPSAARKQLYFDYVPQSVVER